MKYILTVALLFSGLCFALNPGDKAPNFSLKASDGKTYDLSKVLKSHDAAAVIFVATRCPYSNDYNTRYNKLVKTFANVKGKKIAFLAINSNDTESMDNVKKHAAEKKFSFPVLKDPKPKNGSKHVSDLFGAKRTPEAYLVGKDQTILYHGSIDDGETEAEVTRKHLVMAATEYVSGKKVSKKKTKAFGCSIKR